VASVNVILAVSTVEVLVRGAVTVTTVNLVVVTPEVLVQGVRAVLKISEEEFVFTIVIFRARAVATVPI